MIVSVRRFGPVLVAYVFGCWRFGPMAAGVSCHTASVRRLFAVSGVLDPFGRNGGVQGYFEASEFWIGRSDLGTGRGLAREARYEAA